MKIRGFESYSIDEHGVVINDRTGRILKHDLSAHQYPRVTLSENNQVKRFFVHRLVAIHFIPNWFDYPMVNHIDGDKSNNSVSNLEWVNCKQNTIHAFRTGLRASGEKHYCAKLTTDVVDEICKEISSGKTRGEILNQERFKHVSRYAFDDIRRRRSWKQVSCNYDWEGATTISKESTLKRVEAPDNES